MDRREATPMPKHNTSNDSQLQPIREIHVFTSVRHGNLNRITLAHFSSSVPKLPTPTVIISDEKNRNHRIPDGKHQKLQYFKHDREKKFSLTGNRTPVSRDVVADRTSQWQAEIMTTRPSKNFYWRIVRQKIIYILFFGVNRFYQCCLPKCFHLMFAPMFANRTKLVLIGESVTVGAFEIFFVEHWLCPLILGIM